MVIIKPERKEETVMSQKYYEREFLKKVIKLRLEEGRTIPSLCSEYGIARV